MRIMFAVPSYWPSQDGVAYITGYLAQGLAARGHDVFVLTSAGNGGLQKLPEYEGHENVQVSRMRIYTRWPLKYMEEMNEALLQHIENILKNIVRIF